VPFSSYQRNSSDTYFELTNAAETEIFSSDPCFNKRYSVLMLNAPYV